MIQILTRKARQAGKVVGSRVFLHEALRTLLAWVALVGMAVWMIVCQQWSDMRWLQRFEHDKEGHHHGGTARMIHHLLRSMGLGHSHGHIRNGTKTEHPADAGPWPQYALLHDQVLEHLPRLERGWISDELVSSAGVMCVLGCLIMSRGWRERLMMLRRLGWMVMILYFLRSITISVTTMPPPRASCAIYVPHTVWELLRATPQILGGSMSQCTDDMFSGHTVIFTISFLFLRTYATHWTIVVYAAIHALAGILSVLLARYHYTVDVVVAALLTYMMHRTYYAALDAAIWTRRLESGEVAFVSQLRPEMAMASDERRIECGGEMGNEAGDGTGDAVRHTSPESHDTCTVCSSSHASINVSEGRLSEHEMQLLNQTAFRPADNITVNMKYGRTEQIRMLGTSRPVGTMLPRIVAWMDGLDLRYK
ncbi:hypothetical protein EV175_006214 [Coemansia sp. RSA 1933]|nr:hypothetical protein EV175_006214 [Coemansia sp. RSA 1933]